MRVNRSCSPPTAETLAIGTVLQRVRSLDNGCDVAAGQLLQVSSLLSLDNIAVTVVVVVQFSVVALLLLAVVKVLFI